MNERGNGKSCASRWKGVVWCCAIERMNDPNTLFWGLMFGAVGMGYFMYGKNMAKPVPMLVGIALCVFPYFVKDTLPLILIGGALMLLPAFVGRE